MKKLIFVVMALATSACVGSDAPPQMRDVESNALGISYVEIGRSIENGDPLLTLRGFDSENDEIGALRLRTGMVLYSPEPEFMPKTLSLGTELNIRVNGEEVQVITPDILPHTVRVGRYEEIESFLRLKPVAAELQREAGIVPSEPQLNEVPLLLTPFAVDCPSWAHPDNITYDTCCYVPTWHATYGIRQGLTYMTERNGNYVVDVDDHPVACRGSDGTTPCSGGACDFGPCGFEVSINHHTNYEHVNKWTLQGARCDLTFYNASPQTVFDWSGVTGSCIYRTCTDGVPGT